MSNKYGTTRSYAVIIPIGTTPKLVELAIDTPADYKTLRGYYIVRNSGTDYIEVGLKTNDGLILTDIVNISHYQVGTGGTGNIEIEKKFYKKTPCEAGGKKLILSVKTYAPNPSIEVQDFTVLLHYDNKEIDAA